MEKIIINIGASSNHFGAFSENCPGIYGAGDTVQEAKENVLEGLRLLIKHNQGNLPEILKGEYEIIFKFDVISFLRYYSKSLSLSGLQTITGINQRQLSHYVTGRKKPSLKTVEKIEKSVRAFAEEISQVEFMAYTEL
jgi:Helix-turn-helix.